MALIKVGRSFYNTEMFSRVEFVNLADGELVGLIDWPDGKKRAILEEAEDFLRVLEAIAADEADARHWTDEEDSR